MKFSNLFRNLLGIKRAKLYSDTFRFDIFYCTTFRGLVFLPDTVYNRQLINKLPVFSAVSRVKKSRPHRKLQFSDRGDYWCSKHTFSL